MPQISKIRIVNCKYNDGKRLIPDEIYDLSDGSGNALNSLFNLNNGGGKTVLVQLMMQPIHPRAMAGGRHIEDYFGQNGDHGYVLLEWNLDESNDKLLTGISIAASQRMTNDENQRGNAIKYYTFMSQYSDNSPYSISELELSKNENGRYVPESFEYIREKAKRSGGALQCYSSDESVKWNDKLANEFNILRSEWESVIETLNKDEGGLNQYFDDAKTSDKLISKFFIPAIEQKMKNVSVKGYDSSLETMLINYAKKVSDKEKVIKERDINRLLLGSLSELQKMSDELYGLNDNLMYSIGEAFGLKSALKKETIEIKQQLTNIAEEIENLKEQRRHIDYEKKSKEYYHASDQYDIDKKEFEIANENLEAVKKELELISHKEDILQCAKLNRELIDMAGAIKGLQESIEAKEKDSDDAALIAKYKYSIMVLAGNTITELDEKNSQVENSLRIVEEDIKKKAEEKKNVAEELEKAEKAYNKAKAELTVRKEHTDKVIEKLEIGVQRHFDGFYFENELENERLIQVTEKTHTEHDLGKKNKRLFEIESRLYSIPEERAEQTTILSTQYREKEQIEKDVVNYNGIFTKVSLLCHKYSLEVESAFSGRLKSVVKEEKDAAEASLKKYLQNKEILNERLEAAQNGHIHVIPEIMEYVRATGISYQTGEEYLCNILKEGSISSGQIDEILSVCPEMAYSLLFSNERDVQNFLSAGNIDWLPALVPIFTMNQVNKILNGTQNELDFLAAYDHSYFIDPDGYAERITKEINNVSVKIEQVETNLNEMKEELQTVEKFVYSDSWYDEQSTALSQLNTEIEKTNEKIGFLDVEKEKLEIEKGECKEAVKSYDEKIKNLERWLDDFSDLLFQIDGEKVAEEKQQKLYIHREQLQNHYKGISKEYDELDILSNRYREEIKDINERLKEVKSKKEKVEGARETAIIQGELNALFAQYSTISESMNDDLARLRQKLSDYQKKMEETNEQLHAYSCMEEEYVSINYSNSAWLEIRKAKDEVEEKNKAAQSVYNLANSKYSSSEASLNKAKDQLGDYNGEALSRKEIGDDFSNRLSQISEKQSEILGKQQSLDKKEREITRMFDQVEDAMANYDIPDPLSLVILQADVKEQCKIILHSVSSNKLKYDKKKDELLRSLIKCENEYKDIALSEIVNNLSSIERMLTDSGIKGDRLYTVSSSIDEMTKSIEKINSKIETDLREIANDFNDIVNQCVTQGKRMYDDLRKIADSSRAHIFEGKPQTQMVKMNLPEEKEISDEASKIAIRNEIELGANEIKELIKNGTEEKQIRKRAKVIVGSERLLHKYIRQDSIEVKVFKIDISSENSTYKRWEETLTQNSGAEKFVIFFAVVLTLMNYTRSESGLVTKNNTSVIILDNPFGKITSAHLLKPMFDIAKHFHVQLICLSDINKSDVINCFENVIKLVIKEQSLSNFAIMTHEGNERIEHGYYKIMNGQMSLFDY